MLLTMCALFTYSTYTNPIEHIPKIDLSLYKAALVKNLGRIVDIAAGHFMLCIENYGLNDIAMPVLQSYLDSGDVSLCWDIAKTFNDIDVDRGIENFLIRNIEHIREVHLHDLSALGKSHQVIGDGIIDFSHYLSLLSRADVVEYCIEVRPREKAKESLERLQYIFTE